MRRPSRGTGRQGSTRLSPWAYTAEDEPGRAHGAGNGRAIGSEPGPPEFVGAGQGVRKGRGAAQTHRRP